MKSSRFFGSVASEIAVSYGIGLMVGWRPYSGQCPSRGDETFFLLPWIVERDCQAVIHSNSAERMRWRIFTI